MRNYEEELTNRVAFIRKTVADAGANGVIFGNSGGKDCALVGILAKKACGNTVSVIMPCQSKRNYDEDKRDAEALARQFGIETLTVDLTETKNALLRGMKGITLPRAADTNINPRLRMLTLYAVAQSRGLLVAGTGNRSERYTGYFTKWGDGACDFNPISDLTVREVYEFLRFLDAPASILQKAPSAGLFEGQTDEAEMGITYDDLDDFLLYGTGEPETIAKIERLHAVSEHKRKTVPMFMPDEKVYERGNI